MSLRPYTKTATSYSRQVEILTERGMLVEDPEQAAFYLSHLNYYRLGAYWLPMEADHVTHSFKPGSRFSDVLNFYIFDRELRLLLMDALERFEVSIRTQWAYQMGHRHGAHSHLDSTLAYRPDRWVRNLESLQKEVERSDETFIKHFTDTYEESLPPVWAACEVMSLGLLSRWYANLKPMATRSAIAGAYGVDQQVLGSWLHHLTLIRNTCAHHSRLWNRRFPVTPSIPHKTPALSRQFRAGDRKLYNALLILLHCMDRIAPAHHWRKRLITLIDSHAIPVADMGFPADWKSQSLWQEVNP